MKTALKCAKFDILVMSAYKKTCLIMALYPLLMCALTRSASSGVAFGMCMSVVMLIIPFSLEERFHTDELSLPVDRASQVRGRFLMLLISIALLVVVFLAEGIICSLVIGLVTGGPPDLADLLPALLISTCVATLMLAFQLPFLYKMGYTKARLIIVSPFLFVGLGVPVLVQFLDGAAVSSFATLVANNPALFGVLLLAVVAAAMLASYAISFRIYTRR